LWNNRLRMNGAVSGLAADEACCEEAIIDAG
jgi:hypothetical protein